MLCVCVYVCVCVRVNQSQASKLMPARMPGAAKNFAGSVNSSYWQPAQHSKLEPAGNYHTNGDLG